MKKKFWGRFIVHRSSFIVHRFQSIAQSPQVVLAHELLEDLWPRQESEAFAEESAAAETMEMPVVGERARLKLLNAEKIGELRMLAVENRSRLADRVLPPSEGIDAHPMVMPRDRSGVVLDAQALSLQAVRQLDVFPGGRRECRIERIFGKEPAVEGYVRGVEKVEGSVLTIADQLVAELQAVVVDVVHEGRDPLACWPAGVTKTGQERIVVRFAV